MFALLVCFGCVLLFAWISGSVFATEFGGLA